MKFKERSCSRTDFLHSAADVIETPWLMNAMVANRIHAMQSDISMQNAASEHAHSKSNAFDHHTVEDLLIFSKQEKNFPEADDILTIAGVDPNDEAKLMLAQESHYNKSSQGRSTEAGLRYNINESQNRSINARLSEKNSSRKMTELCIFARVAGRPGILPSAGICRVENKVYSLLEEALQVHMRNLIMKIVDRAFQRNDSKKIVHGQYNIHSEPKQRIRQINVDAETRKRERVENERKALLRVGESILSKRKSYFEEDSHLKEKVAKIRQEEEERIRATIANEAARSALGSAKYLKWFIPTGEDEADEAGLDTQKKDAQDPIIDQFGGSKQDVDSKENRHAKRPKDGRGAMPSWTISLKDCRDVMVDEYKRFEVA